MIKYLITTLTFYILVKTQLALDPLQQQIRNTQQIIYLYTQKLTILKNIYHEQYPSRLLQPSTFTFNFNQTKQPKKQSQNLLLLKQFNENSFLLSNGYLVNNKKIINMDNGSIIADIHGDVLIVEDNLITTLAYNKISLTQIKKNQNGMVLISQYLVGLNALQLESMWHRNLNIKDGQDLLIQWQQNIIYFRGKQTNMIQLPKQEKIIQIFPFNQYKIIFVSNLRIGIINSRSLQIGKYIPAENITRIKNKTSVEIVSTYLKQNFINILLNTGQITRYYNQKIIHYIIISKLSSDLQLQSSKTQMQHVNQYIFIISHTLKIMKVYDHRYMQLQTIQLPINQDNMVVSYDIFYENNLYKVMVSSSTKTKIYQILIDQPQEEQGNYIFLKVFSFGLVICGFIYFKWIKKGDENNQDYKNMVAMKKGKNNQNRKGEVSEGQMAITRAQLQKSGFSQDEIQQFLLFQQKQKKV